MALTTSAPKGGLSYGKIHLPINIEGKAKIKPVYTGLCGTDRAEIAGGLPFTYNPVGQDYMIIGHEAVCQVLDIEENNFGIKSGDYVVPVVRRRGSCINCRIGRPDNCSDVDHDIREAGIRGLDTKTKELIALGLSIASRCGWCISYHVNQAIKAGATRKELMEAGYVTVLMYGSQALMEMNDLLDAINQFEIK